MSRPLGVGVVGCGAISGIYLKNLRTFSNVRVVACADLDAAAAGAGAAEHGVPAVRTPDEILGDPDVDIVLNLTTPDAHAPVALAAVRAGKHVYNEKPLTIALDEARLLLEEASSRGVRVGCAPDTVLGAGVQTCRSLIDAGAIGQPVAASAFMTCRGHESWHPSPAFYYKRGGGPMFDMGPYYLTALVTLLGPVRRVTGSARRTFAARTITSEPRRGETIDVEVPTHLSAVLDFAGGAVATLIMSFDVHAARLPIIEVYGSDGSMAVPDPNSFGGPVEVFDPAARAWAERPLAGGYSENSRGIGVAEMAEAIAQGRPHRASGAIAVHVLEIMHAAHTASAESRHVELTTTCERPEPLPPDWRA